MKDPCLFCLRTKERMFIREREISEKDQRIRELELQVARLERLNDEPIVVWPPYKIPDAATVGGV